MLAARSPAAVDFEEVHHTGLADIAAEAARLVEAGSTAAVAGHIEAADRTVEVGHSLYTVSQAKTH